MTFVNNPCAPPFLIHRLTTHPLLSELPMEVLHDLGARAELRSYRTGEVVFHEGDPAHHWLLVECGHVELVRYDTTSPVR